MSQHFRPLENKSIRFLAWLGSTVSLICGVVWLGSYWQRNYWTTGEASYHIRELKRLAEEELDVHSGYAIDDSVDKARFHRDRLASLGVMFTKSYKLKSDVDSTGFHRQLAKKLMSQSPKGGYWELTMGNALFVWDLAEKEHHWDSFVENLLNEGALSETNTAGE